MPDHPQVQRTISHKRVACIAMHRKIGGELLPVHILDIADRLKAVAYEYPESFIEDIGEYEVHLTADGTYKEFEELTQLEKDAIKKQYMAANLEEGEILQDEELDDFFYECADFIECIAVVTPIRESDESYNRRVADYLAYEAEKARKAEERAARKEANELATLRALLAKHGIPEDA